MKAPLGMIDSGLGGLTVLKEVQRLLPNEDIVYLADTQNLPYGNKSIDDLVEISRKNIDILMQKNIKALIIACHTLSTSALDAIRNLSPVPIIDIMQPCIELIKTSTFKRLGLLGTRRTIESHAYQNALCSHFELLSIPCPFWASLVEEGLTNHSLAKLIVQETLHPLTHCPIDALVLVCTHYPFLEKLIRSTIGDFPVIIDPAKNCALQAKEILKSPLAQPDVSKPAAVEFLVSGDRQKFLRTMKKILKNSSFFTEKR